jgi:hypothetical protein
MVFYLYDINFQFNDKIYKNLIRYNNIHDLCILKNLVKYFIIDSTLSNNKSNLLLPPSQNK